MQESSTAQHVPNMASMMQFQKSAVAMGASYGPSEYAVEQFRGMVPSQCTSCTGCQCQWLPADVGYAMVISL